MRGLKDKRVLITGGASGIGAATAARFLEEGARVCVIDRDDAACARIKHELPALGEAIIADVTDLMQVEAAFAEAIRLMDGVDVLINNAGISVRHKFLDITPEEWDRVIAVEPDRRVLCGADRGAPHVGTRQRSDSADRVDERHHGISALRRLQRDQGGCDRVDEVDGARTGAESARVRGGPRICADADATRRIF